jgi:hypothetical protein
MKLRQTSQTSPFFLILIYKEEQFWKDKTLYIYLKSIIVYDSSLDSPALLYKKSLIEANTVQPFHLKEKCVICIQEKKETVKSSGVYETTLSAIGKMFPNENLDTPD